MSDQDADISAHSTTIDLREPIGEHVEDVEGEGTLGSTEVSRKADGSFTSEGARKAVLARWEKQRQREAEAATEVAPEDAKLVLVPIGVGMVIRRLDQDARKGSTQAARELRAWIEQYPPQDDSFDPASMDRRTRAKLYAIALARIDELEQPRLEEVPAN